MYKIKLIKNFLITITFVIFLSIVFLSIDVISETGNVKSFDIDFKNNHNIISAYGTLIGGILSFLSILFVSFGLLEQRQLILDEKSEKDRENKKELLEKLRLLSNYFKSAINDIIEQGKIIKEFYESEKSSPSKMHKMYFTTNRNFTRAIDIDTLAIYKAVQFYFKDDENWEDIFLNIYNLFDFYSEALKELKEKYNSQTKFKVEEQRKIASELKKLLNLCTDLVDEYKLNFGEDYLSHPWTTLVNDFVPSYYSYLEECEEKNEASDFREISNKYLLPFLKEAMKIRSDFGFDSLGSRNIVSLVSDIRKLINEIEFNCIYYAEDVEKQYIRYFNETNESIIQLKELHQKFLIFNLFPNANYN